MQPHQFPGDDALSLCPLTYFRDYPSIEGPAFNLHLHWTKGILPVPGGLDDQPADYQLVIAAVEHGVNAGRRRLQEVEQRRAEREAGKGNKGRSPTRGRR